MADIKNIADYRAQVKPTEDKSSSEYFLNTLKGKPSPEFIHSALRHADPEVRSVAAGHTLVDPSHIDRALKDTKPEVRRAALKQPHVSAAQLLKVMNSKSTRVRADAVRHPNADTRVYNAALQGGDTDVIKAMAQRSELPHPVVQQLMRHPDVSVRLAAFRALNNGTMQPVTEKPRLSMLKFDGNGQWMLKGETVDLDAARRKKQMDQMSDTPAMREMKRQHRERCATQQSNRMAEERSAKVKQANTDLKQEYGLPVEPHRAPVETPAKPKSTANLKVAKALETIDTVIKALTAGYGGAGTPTSRMGGSVIQTEKMEDGRKGLKCITCHDCGKEAIYMKHQTKCRDCGKPFSLSSLEKLITTE